MDPLFYVADTLIFVGIIALLTLSLNLEYGFTGLANLGTESRGAHPGKDSRRKTKRNLGFFWWNKTLSLL
ncbi:MAG: hypothetical protein AB1426_09540 [Bacillota bacterium]